ncbi:hypothetical protein [Stenotrophomonas maltophilia]|uniref:hypothetical protein n=1 Tax=Stenotrophomonas maltophilia TaxID=40324 RepID=UPI0039F6DAAF
MEALLVLALLSFPALYRTATQPSGKLHVNPVRPLDHPRHWSARASLVAVATVIIAVGVPRIAGLSGFPLTDEGYYAYFAMRIGDSLASGQGLPGDGYLMLYPMLTSWVFSLPENPFVLLRIVDLLIAVASGLLFFRVLVRESGSLPVAALLSVSFLLAMNASPFIQNGFKNSFFVAYLPLFLAMLLSQADTVTRSRWAVIGALVAACVLLRESFAPFALLAVVAVWIRHGFRSTIALCGGAALTAVIILLVVLSARGGVTGLIESYQDAAISFAALQGQKNALFLSGATTAMQFASIPLLLTALALVALLPGSLRTQRRPVYGRAAFWLVASLLPLIEPASKIGFAYHFSACLPGMAGLCAWTWRSLPAGRWRSAATGALTVAAALSLVPAWQMVSLLPAGLKDARRTAEMGWSEDQHEGTNYLIAADLIRGAAPEGGTLSVSGFMYPLFPLTDLRPPSPALSDLSLALIKGHMDGNHLTAALQACSPDVILTSNRTEFPGADILDAAVRATGLYTKFGEVAVDPNRAYGTFGGNVYRKVREGGSACGIE